MSNVLTLAKIGQYTQEPESDAEEKAAEEKVPTEGSARS
jgi:hypothetical protein